MTGKHKMKHRSVALRFTSMTGMMKNMNKSRTPEITNRKILKRMKRSLWQNGSQKIMKKS